MRTGRPTTAARVPPRSTPRRPGRTGGSAGAPSRGVSTGRRPGHRTRTAGGTDDLGPSVTPPFPSSVPWCSSGPRDALRGRDVPHCRPSPSRPPARPSDPTTRTPAPEGRHTEHRGPRHVRDGRDGRRAEGGPAARPGETESSYPPGRVGVGCPGNISPPVEFSVAGGGVDGERGVVRGAEVAVFTVVKDLCRKFQGF